MGLMHGCRDVFYKYPRNYKWYHRCVESVPGDRMYIRYFRVNRWVWASLHSQSLEGREIVHAYYAHSILHGSWIGHVHEDCGPGQGPSSHYQRMPPEGLPYSRGASGVRLALFGNR
eukprot:226180-Pelagomonas_calceolata.AAC.1